MAKTVAEAEKSVEGKVKVSESGRTVYTDEKGNSEDVTINKIVSTEGGIKVELEGGKTVKASDLSFSTTEEALMYEMVARMEVTPDTANEIISTFKPTNAQQGLQYLSYVPLAYQYGKIGHEAGLKEIGLTEQQKRLAYTRGRMDAITEAEAKAKSTTTASKNKTSASKGKSGIIYENGFTYDESKATDVQKASMAGIEMINKMSSLEVHVFESWVEDGKRVAYVNGKKVKAPNGYFTDGNKIYIDFNAGNNAEGAMLYTMSHEVTHYIRKWNAKGFKELGDFLISEYGKHGVPVHALLEEQKGKIKKRYAEEGKTLPSEAKLADMAYEELVADAMSTMFADPKAYEKLAKLKKKNHTLWQKLGEAIKALLDKIKTALGIYSKYTPDALEADYVSKFAPDVYEKLQDLYLKAFVEADANYASAEQTLASNGIIVDSSTESASLMSVRDILDENQRQDVSKALAARFGVTQDEALQWLTAETSLASLILNPKYSQYLDYTGDPDEVAIKTNSDYPQGTVDFSNICKKRRDFTEVMNRVLRNFPNHVFAATDLAKIRTIMEQEGMEVACAICYVEDRRQLDSVVAQDFIDSLKIYREGGKVRPDGKPFNANQLKAFSLIEGDTYTPSIYELISLVGRNSLKAKNPAMEEAWVKFNNARGMQSVRLLLNDAEYKRQILKYTPAVVERKNDLGGLRIYSFSDMEMFHLIDIIQVITDSATVGLSLQGYTKVNEYAKAVKDTGEKLNRSLIPKGDLGYHMENGKVVLDFDTVEGIDINHPDFFDNIDNPNVGNIVIGINATQIKAAMTSKFIDQIIPFHTGQSGEVLGEKGIAAWENYKDFQSERDVKTQKKSSHQINIYTEVINAAEAEGKPIKNKVDFVNKFLEVCKENNLIPRFSEFLNVDENGNYIYTEGYHKFLVDFKTFDQNTGEYLPQMPVKPLFDNEYITGLLSAYVKSQKVKDAELKKAMPKVLDRITKEIVNPSETKFSDRDSLGEELSKEQIEFFKDSKARDEDGNLLVLYHGTSTEQRIAEFKTTEGWRTGLWLTTDHATAVHFAKVTEYLERDPSDDTKLFTKENSTSGDGRQGVYELYANVKNPLIVDAQNKRYWEIPRPSVMGKGDAVSGEEINRFAFENGYDGVIIIDVIEGSNRLGTDVIVFDKNQVKYTDNLTPTEGNDISYSDRNPYSYEALTSKPDMKLTTVGITAPNNRADIVAEAKKNAANVGKINPKDGSVSVRVEDIGSDVLLGTDGLTHGLRRGKGLETNANAIVTVKAGEILKSSIRINELTPSKVNATGSYILIGAATDPNGDLYIVRSVVNQFSNELTAMDVLYAVNAKKEELAALNAPRSTAKPLSVTNSTISIAQLLDFVNTHFPDVLPESVLRHYGYDARPEGELGESALYSDRTSYAPTFYSHMGKVIDDIKLEKMGASSILNHLKNRGVKDEEIKWSGIETFLEGKKSVTKAELQEFIAGSQLVIEEEMSDPVAKIDIRKVEGEDYAYALYDENGNELDRYFYDYAGELESEKTGETFLDVETLEEEVRRDSDHTRWSQYKLDGGENYRELVFKLPNSSYTNRAMRAHWGQDAEGILVHARIQDFEVDGKKMLFIEEIQSDWHNEGHSKGYSTKEYEDAVESQDKLYNEYKKLDLAFHKYVRSNEFMTDPEDVRKKKHDWLRGKVDAAYEKYLKSKTAVDSLKQKGAGDTPDAPFKDTYHEYVLKRLLRMAAEEGYDSIGWTPADIQSDRWSEDYAEAYRIEYDQEMPKFLRKYGKKWGATVGKTAIEGNGKIEPKEIDFPDTAREYYSLLEITRGYNIYYSHEPLSFTQTFKNADNVSKAGTLLLNETSEWMVRDNPSQKEVDEALKWVKSITNHFERELEEAKKGQTVAVWSMDITDSMKESVLYEGQVLYQDRDTNSASNRSLLANALESIAQNDIEKNKLTEYKKKIALIESEQAKLSEIKAKANELRFTKGRTPAETKKMRDLDFEATQITNRINTYDKQLLNLESTAALKNVLEREKTMLRKRLKQKEKEAIKGVKEKAAETQRELMTRYQESRKNAIEGRNKTALRQSIKKVVSDLNSLLLKPTKDKHVPIGLQLVVSEALDAINMDTMNAGERVAYYNDLIAKSSDPDEIDALTKKRDFFEYRDANFKERITALKNAYAEFKESDDPLIRNAHNEAIEDLIKNTADAVGNKSLKDMSLAQLEAVYNMYKAISATVKNANKMFKEGRQETVTANSEAVKTEVKEVGGHKDRTLKMLKAIKKFGWNMLKPITAMKVVGSKTFAKLFDNVRAGEDTWAVDVSEAKEFYENTASKYGFKKWDFKKSFSFKDSVGNDFSLTLEQIMSLYAYSKREQADKHLEFGGFIFDDAIEVTERKGKFGIPLKYEVNDANPYRLRKEDLIAVTDSLTKEQKGFIDEMQTYLSDVMGAKGNEVSLAMYDIKLYNEKNYFPLKTSRYFREFDPEKAGTPKIKNAGFSKKTVPQAGNPIVLANFMDVWAGHVNDMSMYHAFVLPLEDFLRVYNYSSTAGGYDSVQQYIKNAYGVEANQYIERLMDDLNGGARVDSVADPMNKLISLHKKASVFASASVVIQQPSAIARALAYINPKYFVTATPSAMNFAKHKSQWAEVKKYAPVAIIKDMGYFDTGVGRSTVEWIKGNQTLKDKMDDVLSKAPAIADELCWVHIWEAVKRETAAKGQFKVGSEEFLEESGRRFTEVITNTQVYDSVLSRSGFMRSKDTGVKMAMAFMAEPTTTVNMMVDGIIQGKRGNKKFTGATIGAVASSIILNSILVSLVYAARDDDEDETYAEKYIGSLTTELIDGFIPLTYLPYVKDIWSMAQGYDVERSDMALLSDLVDTIERLFNENKSGLDKVLDVTGSISSLFGIPLKNLIRDAKGMYNLAATLLSGTPTTKGGVGDALEGALTSSLPLWDRIAGSESKSDKLYDAIMSGDKEYQKRIESSYKDSKAVESAKRQALRENDPRIKKAAQARLDGDISEYTRIAKEIIAEGNFAQDTVVAAINAEITALKKGEGTESTTADSNKVASIYKVDDYYVAIAGRDEATAYAVKEDMIRTDVANGKDRDEAEADFNSKFASHLRELYEKGDITDYKAKSMLINYGGKSEEEAQSKVQYWDFKKRYPDYDLSEEAVEKYYSEVQPAGIGISVYYDYTKLRAKCKGTDTNGDGKTDSGSVKAEVLKVINSLPITSAQKDALYYLNGWSKSTIYEAPWR